MAFDLHRAELSPAGLELIEYFEGWETKELDENGKWTGFYLAYKKGNDPWTVGPGLTQYFRTTGKVIEKGARFSHQECVDEMYWRLHNEVYRLVREHFNPRNQNEFDACTSFTWNVDQDKIARGEYPITNRVLSVARLTDPNALNELISTWVLYKNPKTPFEAGLYRRRIAEMCMFLGLPWKYATAAVFVRDKLNPNIIKEATDVFHVIAQARKAAAETAKAAPLPPPPPKATPAARPAPDTPPPPVKTEPKPVAVGTKPASPNTKKPEEVPYRIDPNAGLKPLEETDRGKGFFWQQAAVLFLRITGLGTFGTGAAQVANIVQSDAALSGALFNLTIPLLVLITGVVVSFVMKSYGDWKRKRGEETATQGMY